MSKDNEKKVSIIVPIFNAERFINRCLHSIKAQTYSNIEIVLVNDGSKDNSLKICEEFAKVDPRFLVFHKQNGGASSARNLGLTKATGYWITFIDSDDYVSNSFIEDLVAYIEETDLVVTGFQYCGSRCDVVGYEDNWSFNVESQLSKIWNRDDRKLCWYMCSKLFKRSIIVDNSIHFDEKQRYGEDFCFVMDYLRFAKTLTITNKNGYYYSYTLGNSTLAGKYPLNIEEYMYHLDHNIKRLSLLETRCGQLEYMRKRIYVRLYTCLMAHYSKMGYKHILLSINKIPSDYLKKIVENCIGKYQKFIPEKLFRYTLLIYIIVFVKTK